MTRKQQDIIDRLIALAEFSDLELAREARDLFPAPKPRKEADPRINELVAYAKQRIGIAYDGGSFDRIACANFFRTFAKQERFKDDDHVALVKQVVDTMMAHEFWSGKITNLAELYNRRGKFISLMVNPRPERGALAPTNHQPEPQAEW